MVINVKKNTRSRNKTPKPPRKKIEKALALSIIRELGLPRDELIKELKKFCRIDEKSNALLKEAVDRLKLSARSYHHILKVSRTIADLALSEKIHAEHLAEAIQYRRREAT